jgi:hypothetical protein
MDRDCNYAKLKIPPVDKKDKFPKAPLKLTGKDHYGGRVIPL